MSFVSVSRNIKRSFNEIVESMANQFRLRAAAKQQLIDDARQGREYMIVYKALPIASRTPRTTLNNALASLTDSRAKKILGDQISTYWRHLYRSASHYFETRQQSNPEFPQRFLDSLTFQTAFESPVFLEHVGNIREDIQILHDLYIHISTGTEVSGRKRKFTHIDTGDEEQSKAKSLTQAVEWVDTQWQRLHDSWLQQTTNVLSKATALKSKQLCEQVQERLERLRLDLSMDAVSLFDEEVVSYEQTCEQCMTKVVQEWLDAIRSNDIEKVKAYMATMEGMVKTTTTNTSDLQRMRDQLRPRLYGALLFQTMRRRSKKKTKELEICARDMASVAALVQQTDPTDQLAKQLSIRLENDGAAHQNEFDRYCRRNEQLGQVITDEYLGQLRSHEMSLDRLSGINDVAHYVQTMVNITRPMLDDEEWRALAEAYMTEQQARLPACQYMPHVYRNAHKEKHRIYETAVQQVKEAVCGDSEQMTKQIVNDYLPQIRQTLNRIESKASVDSSSQSNELTAPDWPYEDVPIPINRLEKIQELSLQAHHELLETVKRNEEHTSEECHEQLFDLMSTSKRFVEASECTLSVAWKGIMALFVAQMKLQLALDEARVLF
jgi:hypothetical protein